MTVADQLIPLAATSALGGLIGWADHKHNPRRTLNTSVARRIKAALTRHQAHGPGNHTGRRVNFDAAAPTAATNRAALAASKNQHDPTPVVRSSRAPHDTPRNSPRAGVVGEPGTPLHNQAREATP